MKREARGFWWIPGKPELRSFGALQHSFGKSPELELLSENQLEEFLKSLHESQVLHGFDEQGVPITLLHVSEGNSSRSWNSHGFRVGRLDIHCSTALVGLHTNEVNATHFKEVEIELQHFGAWYGKTGFFHEGIFNDSEISLKHKRFEPDIFAIDDDLDIKLGISVKFDTSNNDGERAWKISETATIQLVSKKGITLQESDTYIDALNLLIHFAALKPIQIKSLVGKINRITPTTNPLPARNEVQIWNSQIHGPSNEIINQDSWTFRYRDIKESFAKVFSNTLQATKELAESLKCYTTVIYLRPPSELEHLCLVQALEAFHDTKRASFNKKGLKSKIENLTKDHLTELNGIILDAERFAEQVAESRHFYTHHNPEDLLRGKVARGNDLIRLNELLKILFQVCMLKYLEVPAPNFNSLQRQIATKIVNYAY